MRGSKAELGISMVLPIEYRRSGCRTTRHFPRTVTAAFARAKALRLLFEQTVDQCIAQGMVGGEGFAIDANVVRADAHFDKAIKQMMTTTGLGQADQVVLIASILMGWLKGFSRVNAYPRLTQGAQWTAAPGGPAFFAYSTNYLIDVDAGIIVDVEAHPCPSKSRSGVDQGDDRTR